MIEIGPVEWFHAGSMAPVASFPNPKRGSRKELSDRYLGKEVLIEGKAYKVRGVEMFAIEIQREGIMIGLAVTPLNRGGK
jgi:hypothetical protein